jgi:biopolymer transport protein ExbD
MQGNPQDVVIVNADEGVNYGLVVEAMDRAKQAGIRKFALAVEAGGEK